MEQENVKVSSTETAKKEKVNIEQQNSPATAIEELQLQLADYYQQFSTWLAFNPDESAAINWLRLLYKIPLTIVVLLLSPILFIFIMIAFFAAF